MSEPFAHGILQDLVDGESGIKSGPFGTSLSASEYGREGVPVISVGEVGYGEFRVRPETPRVDATVTSRLGDYVLRKGDIVFGRKGAVDRSAWVSDDQAGWFLGSDGLRVRVRSGVDSRFVSFQLRAPSSRSWLLQHAGGSTLLSLNQTTLGRVPMLIPSLAEQRGIAEVLGALDDKIAANTRAAGAAEAVLRAEIDLTWLTRDDRSASIADYLELNPSVPMPQADSAIYIDMKRLPESGWSIDGFDMRRPKGGARFLNGDTLLARITPCLENRKTGYVDQLERGQVAVGSTEFIVLRSRPGVAAPLSFLLATAPRFRDFAIQHMVGTSGRQRVAASDLAEYRIPKPDPAWLQDFGDRAIRLFETVASQTRESRTLAATRDALLPQLMSGKLRVRDAEAIAADAGA
ncbi:MULTISPECIES: restriction endonuclease subunit S [Microbacterium]|uniref:restriction endonuclease subunit S n=1 Tax=Microbacterium TaxID=33882 RepID=UPI0027D91B0F|nr:MULTISPECIES: restriction endonuclease subunit S [Microbacterium]